MKHKFLKMALALTLSVGLVVGVSFVYTNTTVSGETTKENKVTLPTIKVCSHNYVEKVDANYLKSSRNFVDGDIYYKSCKKCGKKHNAETFEANDPYIYGDADDDGFVDDTDMLLLIQYVANYDEELGTSSVEVEPGADANGDGVIDSEDRDFLIQYVANYDWDFDASTVALGQAATPTITMSSEAAKAGDTVTLDLVVSDNPGFATMTTTLSYDKNVLTFKKVESSVLAVATATNVVLYDETGENYTDNGVICTFTFEVAKTAEDGDFEVSALFRTAKNEDKQKVTFTSTSGKITVEEDTTPSATFDEAAINVGENLGLNIFATIKNIANPAVKFTMGSGGYEKTETVIPEDLGSGKIKATFGKITAERMADNIKIEILDGTTVVATKNYSVKEYCKSVYESTAAEIGISQEKYDALVELCANMLTYGAKAQAYVDYNTESLADADTWVSEKINSYTITSADNNKETIATKTGEDKIKSAYITLGKEVALHFYVKADDATGKSLVVYYGQMIDANKKVYSLTNKVKVGTEEYYQIDCGGFSAGQFGQNVSAYLVDGQSTNLHGVSYSINSYAYSKWNTTEENLQPLVRALYSYGQSAVAYATAK